MYLASEALRLMQKTGKPDIATADAAVLKNYKSHIDKATRFIPLWVKVAVALALGLGTMVGMEAHRGDRGREDRQEPSDLRAGRRGRNHRDGHDWRGGHGTACRSARRTCLSSGVAGTMMANHSGLQWATVRNLLMAWVLTLPVAMMLSGFLFYFFRQIF